MASNSQSAVADAARTPVSRPLFARALVVGVVATTVLLYAPALGNTVRKWWTDPASSHGFLVVPLAAYLAWGNRGLVAARWRPWGWGLLPLTFGLLLYPAAVVSQIEFLPAVSLLVTAGGLLLTLLGPAVCRELAFPYAFLFFAVPWPDTLVELVSFPMQLFSAKYAAMSAGLLGLGVARDGVDIHLGAYTFTVGAPCSGMKSLVSLLALAALFAYLLRGPMWKRLCLFAAGFPLALSANVIRIAVILVIARALGPKAAEGFLHGFSGVIVFLVATGGLLLVGRALRLVLGGPQRPEDVPPGIPTPAVTEPHRGHVPAAVAVVLILGTSGLAAVLRAEPVAVTARPVRFGSIAMRRAGWRATDRGPLDRQSQEMLKPDAYLARLYVRPDGFPVDVTIVYGHAKETFHSPGYCLLGGGWNITRKARYSLDTGATGGRVDASCFSLQRGDERRVALYWYVSAGETTPNWVMFQYRLLRNRLTGRPATGALVRFIAPAPGPEEDASRAIGELVRAIYPDLRATMSL